jgi:hypothetical protein
LINESKEFTIVEADGTERVSIKDDNPIHFHKRSFRIGTVEIYCNL